MKTLNIFLRTCEGVKTVGSSERPFNLNKQIIILKCLKSLLESCKGFEKRIRLDIVDDSSSEKFIEKMDAILKTYKINYQIHRTNFKNNGLSMEYAYNIAEESKYDLFYFLEDDYFHLKNELASILDAYDSKIIFSNNFAIYPVDYPRLYNKISPSLIFIGKYNHWRSTDKTTWTLIIPKKLFFEYKKTFYSMANFNKTKHGGEKETLNSLWKKEIPCISPLPSLAAHLHKTSLPYLIDWKNEIDKIKL